MVASPGRGMAPASQLLHLLAFMADVVANRPPSPTPRLLRATERRVRISELWTTRGVALMIGIRDIKAKYKQAALGPLWLIIAPLGLLVAVTVAFSGVTDVQTAGIPYVLFALCGLTVWSFLQLSLTMGSQAIIYNSPLVRRSPLPRVALLTGSMIGNLPPFLIMLSFAVIGAAVSGHIPIQALLLPVMVAWLLLFTLGTILLISSLSVRFRDTISALPLVIQAGIFISPVGYGLEGAPSNIHTLLLINPVTGLIEAWRWCLLDLPNPSIAAMAIAMAWTVVLLAAGWRVFGRMEVRFADYV
jgi:homopolymeric O-antigen transport system permease protein